MCRLVYRFVLQSGSWHWLSLASEQTSEILSCSLTSTGLYKEIARFGKAAAQPFKDIQTSLNDTFATLGNLSAVAPKLVPSTTTISNSLGVRSHSSRVLRAVRRTQSAKLGGQVSGSRSQAEQDVVTTLAGELQALHTAVKESTSLIKLDLQQQTALQVRFSNAFYGYIRPDTCQQWGLTGGWFEIFGPRNNTLLLCHSSTVFKFRADPSSCCIAA